MRVFYGAPNAMPLRPFRLSAMQPHRCLRAAGIALALLLFAAAAQSRIRTYPASVEIGMADAIAIGTAVRFYQPGDDGTVGVGFAVESYLRGSGPRGRLLVQLPQFSGLIEAHGTPESRRCAVPVPQNDDGQRSLERVTVVGGSSFEIRCRDRHVLYLRRSPDGRYHLQRTFPASESERLDRLRELLAHVPAWGKPRQGLATILVTDTPRVAPGDDIEVSLGLKNVSRTPLLLHLGGARDERSHFTLVIVGPDGQRVAAQPHPELDADSMAHFFRHMSEIRTLRLEPGEANFLPSESINSARGGWGYKEQLDFSYYPMPQPGRYRIFGTAQRFLPDAAPQTEVLEIRVD
jgi:hypothetical protein